MNSACVVCGAELDAYSMRAYCSRACRQKAYRARLKAGTVVPRAVRERQAMEARLRAARWKLTMAELDMKSARRRRNSAKRLIKELEARLDDAQSSLPLGCDDD